MSGKTYEFDDYILTAKTLSLMRASNYVALELKVAETLLYLVEHAGDVVPKETLLQAVWPTSDADEGSLRRNISVLRMTLDPADPNRYIETVKGVGYCFIGKVQQLSPTLSDMTTSSTVVTNPITTTHSRQRTYSIYKFASLLFVLAVLTGAIYWSLRTNQHHSEYVATQLTTNSQELSILGASISPDGKMIAFADETGLFVSDINMIERHELSLPKDLLPNYIEWFPDDMHLLVGSNNPVTHQAAVWSFPVLGGAPTLLLRNATKAVASPDGLRIAFIRNETEVWLANADGSSATLFVTALPNEIFAFRPQFSADSRSIIIGSTSSRFDHASIEVRHIDGSMTTSLFNVEKYLIDFRLVGNDELFISWKPNLSSQGTHLTLQKVSLEKGALSSSRELPVLPNYVTLNISATYDGSMVTLINSRMLSDVYMADLQENGTALTNSRRLTLNDSLNRPAGWLADNRTVLFYSDRSGHYGIYRQAIDSIDAYSIVNDDHLNLWPVVSFDQRWLFYFSLEPENNSANSHARLMRMPLAGGESTVVDAHVDAKHSLRCASAVNRCILANHAADKTIYFEFDPEKGRGRELASVPWKSGFSFYDWDVNADGTRIAYIDTATSTDTIGIVTFDHQAATINHLHVAGQEALRTLRWDTAGNGFYISTFDEDQDELKLLHIGIDGSAHLLRQQVISFDGWAMPSPDGKHLAFQKYTNHTNIWLLQRQ